MKVLITGSKGFIGSATVKGFQNSGHEVWGADLATDYGATHYFLIDALNSDYHSIFRSHKFDLCVNCAGAASVPESVVNPSRDFSLNTVNVFRLLDAIRSLNPECNFINLSSAAVYGNPSKLPVSETEPLKPLSPYGYHKKMAEEICSEFNSFFKIRTCSVRVFSAFGRGLKKQLFWDLYQKSRNGSDIQLFGTGNESRDFIHIDDLVSALILISEKAEFKGEAINVGNGEEILIKNAVSTFFSLMNTGIKVQYKGDSRTGDPLNWRADISRLRSYGYTPKVTLNEGLKDYLEWAAKN